VCGPWDELPPEAIREAVRTGLEKAQEQLSDARKARDAATAQGLAIEISKADKRIAALEHAVAILSARAKERSAELTAIPSGDVVTATKSASCRKN
jgi:predicted  nucleic acid-binding Zn-ribbon protein